ncbi:MAG: hypothetical protein AAB131_06510, partial [Actinomycetota bacterium]
MTLNSDTFCQTGLPASPKYVRYFRYNKVPPTIAIVTPITTTPNAIGSLPTITGAVADPTATGINRVEYSLKFTDLSMRWVLYTSTAGSWQTAAQQPNDVWNAACDGTAGCFGSGNWLVWQSSNIAWVDGTNYTYDVRAYDAAGNVSNTAGITFNYDATAPTSFVTSPANQQAYTTRAVSPITGTAIDEVSTGTPSGLSSDFRVGITRLSDSYWWNGSTWTPATGGVYESSIPVTLAAGSGIKTWNLTLSSTFYDLLGATDTFKVFSWAKDLVINPSTAAANRESSTTVKNVFSYASSTPTLTSISPVASTATNVVNSFVLNLDPAGGRIKQVWTVFLTTDNYYWQGSSWSSVQTTDPPPFSGVWLSTDA